MTLLAKRRWDLVFVLIACLHGAGMLSAQTPRASLSGVVIDATGRVVPAVQITLTDIDRGTVYQAQSNDVGLYVLAELNPGNYKVTAQLAGFRTYQINSLALSTQQRGVLNVKLEVGSVGEKVEVTSQVQLLEATSATLGGVMENKSITDLPLNNRNVFTLMALVPGVVPSTPNNYQDESITTAMRYSVNGGQESTTDIQLDGISANAASDIPGIYGLGTLPSVDSIQEFRVQTNAFSAEYGKSGGGIVTMVTKSGTNDFHFDAFEYLRNNAMDANTFFSNKSGSKVAQLQRHQFGGSVAGPAIKNKTFFFGTYEQKVQHAGGFSTFTVPTALQRQGDFSQTFDAKGSLIPIYNPFSTRLDSTTGKYVRDAFAGNVIPTSMIDPVASKATSYYPTPNQAGVQYTQTSNLGLGGVALSPNRRVDLKLDHNISDTKRVFLRYNYFKSTGGAINYFGNPAYTNYGTMDWTTHNVVMDYTQTLSGSTVFDIRGGVSRFTAFRPSFAYGFDIATLGLPASLKAYAAAGSQPMFPMFSISDYQSLGPNYGNGAYYSSNNTNYTLLASLMQVRGRHMLKAGFDARQYLLNFLQIDGSFGASFSKAMTQGSDPTKSGNGNGYASFLLGAATSGYAPFGPSLANASRYFAQYIQDDFKWTPKLTMNLGFRIEEETSATERYDRLSAMDLSVVNPLSQQVGFNVYGGFLFAGDGNSLGRRAIRSPEYKMNPRFGLAYQLNPKTTVRTG